MKSKLSRILLLLVCLALTVGLCLFSVCAAEETTQSEVAPNVWVNPMYVDCVQQPALTVNAGTRVSAPSTFHTDFNSLLNEVRQLAVQRNTSFQVGYKTTQALHSTIANSIADGLYAHTGVPTQGDYIRWNANGHSITGSAEYTSGYYYYTMNVEINFISTAWQEQQVDTAVSNLLRSLNLNGLNDYQKICAVYDYLCDNIVYDYEGLSSGSLDCHTTYSAIILQDTVCQGYASLFYRLMMELGVDTRMICGDASDYPTGPSYGNDEHGWNIVKLDDKWYNLDSTWDAELSQAGYSYQYFLRSDAGFPTHTPWDEYRTTAFINAYPKATSNYVYTPAPNGWYVRGGAWRYGQNGFDLAGWQKIGGTWYYFNGSGAMQTGWVKIGGTYYYMNSSGAMQTGWLKDNNKWYYLNASGAMVTGTAVINGKLNQFDANGVWLGESAASGWVNQGGKWYYYNNGTMATGWLKLGGTYYYMNSAGVMQTGWVKLGSTYYYMNSSGAMQTGWVKLGSTYYYMNSSGAMQTGWVKLGGTYYYMNSSGAMVTGWLQLGGKWYYMSASGAMVTGTVTISGKVNRFDSNGVWLGEVTTSGWVNQGGKWYYYNNGTMATGWLKLGSAYYYMNSAGVMQTGWINVGGTYYYMNSSGVMQTGWQKLGGEWYYLDSSGAMLQYWQIIGGKTYYFDADGAMWHDIWGEDPDGNIYYFCSDGYIYTNGYYWINGYQYYFNSYGYCTNPPYFG